LSGFSLLELTMAVAVLAIGVLGSIVVMGVASANNGSSKLHTTAKALAESTMEKIVAIGSKSTATQTSITDCTGKPFTVETALGPGLPLISGAFANSIDFSRPQQPNYSMNYAMCSSSGNVTYDVRWQIDPGPTPGTQWVTVSAKPLPGAGAPIAQLALPFTLRQIRGYH